MFSNIIVCAVKVQYFVQNIRNIRNICKLILFFKLFLFFKLSAVQIR